MTTVVAAALLLPLGQSTLAQNFKTVQDHFLGIPELPVGSLAQRQRYLRYGLVDIPKGYMRYRASDHPEQFEFAIFAKKWAISGGVECALRPGLFAGTTGEIPAYFTGLSPGAMAGCDATTVTRPL